MISRIVISVLLIIAPAAIGAPSLAASAQATPQNPLSATDLVRATVANEVAAANNNSSKHFFRARKETPQGSQTRIYVETREAMAGMTVAYDDNPLSPVQLQSEEGRLAGLVDNPEQLKRKQRQEKEEANRTLLIVKALPEAFLYDYDGTEPGTSTVGALGMPLARFKFRPNPGYHPPSHVEDVLLGMQGFLLIDQTCRRIARIDGTLFKEVSFGWGILGHLNKGGHFLVEQTSLDDGSWEVSRMGLEFSGKILLFKNITIKSDEVFSNFRRVPADTTFAEGVEMLKAEQVKLAESHGQRSTAETARSR
jgi:hypothetical protein